MGFSGHRVISDRGTWQWMSVPWIALPSLQVFDLMNLNPICGTHCFWINTRKQILKSGVFKAWEFLNSSIFENYLNHLNWGREAGGADRGGQALDGVKLNRSPVTYSRGCERRVSRKSLSWNSSGESQKGRTQFTGVGEIGEAGREKGRGRRRE